MNAEMKSKARTVLLPDAVLVPLPLLSKRTGRNHAAMLKRVEKEGYKVFYFRPRHDHPALTKGITPVDAYHLVISYARDGFALPEREWSGWSEIKGVTKERRELVEAVVQKALEAIGHSAQSTKHSF